MNSLTLTALCVFMTLGMVLANYGSGYGSGSGYQYVPVYPQGPAAGGFGNGGFLMLVGFLFLFTLLLNSNIFNNTATSTTPTISFASG